MTEIESRLATLEEWVRRHEVATCERRKVEFEPGGTLDDVQATMEKQAADKKAADDMMRGFGL